MEKFDELLAKLKKLEKVQNAMEWQDSIPEDIWNEDFKDEEGIDYQEIAHNIDIDTHRWYETSISVILIYGGLLGIRHITNIFSESMDAVDCYAIVTFHKMKETQVITYEIDK